MKRLAPWILPGLLAVSLVWAQHEPSPAHHAEGKSEAAPPSMIWLVLNFALLAGALGYLIRKNAGPFFAARSRQIRKGIVEAEEARAEAEARMAEVDARLANLEAEIAALRREVLAEEEAERERLRQQTAAEIAKIQHQAEQEIASAGKAARLELRRYSAQLALALAEQKIRSRLTAQDQDGLVQGFVGRLNLPSFRAQTSQ